MARRSPIFYVSSMKLHIKIWFFFFLSVSGYTNDRWSLRVICLNSDKMIPRSGIFCFLAVSTDSTCKFRNSYVTTCQWSQPLIPMGVPMISSQWFDPSWCSLPWSSVNYFTWSHLIRVFFSPELDKSGIKPPLQLGSPVPDVERCLCVCEGGWASRRTQMKAAVK